MRATGLLTEMISGLLALMAIGFTGYLAVLGHQIPPELAGLDGLIGGAFFTLRGAAIGGGAAGYGTAQALGNGHPGTTTITTVKEP